VFVKIKAKPVSDISNSREPPQSFQYFSKATWCHFWSQVVHIISVSKEALNYVMHMLLFIGAKILTSDIEECKDWEEKSCKNEQDRKLLN